MKINHTTISIIQKDITTLKVDAIVSAVSPQLDMDKGVAEAIKMKGGRIIEKQAKKKGPIEPGEVIWTNAGKLKSIYVFHVATVDNFGKIDQNILRAATAHCLRLANELKVSSLALPALGCGVARFPVMGAAKIIIQEIMKIVKLSENIVEEITFCIPDEKTYKMFSKSAKSYIDHIQNKLGPGPYVTVDIIIEYKDGIILIERLNPPYGWALPGGFLDYGESLESAAKREGKEETNLQLKNLRQFHTYSQPGRDPRFHTVSTVFIAKGIGETKAGSDAKKLKIVPLKELPKLEFAFDHKQVIEDYLAFKNK